MRLSYTAPVALMILMAGCNGDTSLAPSGGALPTQFSRTIDVPEFEDILGAGPARVEIEVYSGEVVARKVEVEEPEDMFDEEKIESRITAIDDGAGTVTLSLGGLVVSYDDATKFEADDGRGDLSRAEFVQLVQDALAAGGTPAVEAKRPPPASPQDPTDASFLATKLELDDEADEEKIEINIDDDNLSTPAASPPDLVLTVLDLAIELDVTGGRTQLKSEIDDDDAMDETEFEGMVESVSDSSVTLVGGTVIRIVAGTEFDECDDSDELCSLAEVETALANGHAVEAEGEGMVTGDSPRTIVASDIEFEIEDMDDGDDVDDHDGHDDD